MGLHGAVAKRLGSQRLHSALIGTGQALGNVFQWDDPDGYDVVCSRSASGNLYGTNPATGAVELISAGWSTSGIMGFEQHRVGVDIYLYIADMTKGVVQWDGTTETPIATAPSAANGLALYKERMFAIDGSKRLYWSAPADPTVWDLGNDGGFADVETFDTEPIVAICTVGSSLVVWKRNNIARFTGHDTTNMKIDRETEGISAEIGLIGPQAWCKVEEFAFFLSDRGAFIANESSIQEVGMKVENVFTDRTLSDAICVHHRGRREVWVCLPTYGEVYVWDYRTGGWTGPWDNTFSGAARYERAGGAESVVLGGAGWLTDGDIGNLDGVDYAGDGGTNIAVLAELPVQHFGYPHVKKFLRRTQNVEADIADGSILTFAWSSELGNGSTMIPGQGGGIRDYRFRTRGAGRRMTITFAEDSPEAFELTGLILEASTGQRTR
jgi:hypothetical protein